MLPNQTTLKPPFTHQTPNGCRKYINSMNINSKIIKEISKHVDTMPVISIKPNKVVRYKNGAIVSITPL